MTVFDINLMRLVEYIPWIALTILIIMTPRIILWIDEAFRRTKE